MSFRSHPLENLIERICRDLTSRCDSIMCTPCTLFWNGTDIKVIQVYSAANSQLLLGIIEVSAVGLKVTSRDLEAVIHEYLNLTDYYPPLATEQNESIRN